MVSDVLNIKKGISVLFKYDLVTEAKTFIWIKNFQNREISTQLLGDVVVLHLLQTKCSSIC